MDAAIVMTPSVSFILLLSSTMLPLSADMTWLTVAYRLGQLHTLAPHPLVCSLAGPLLVLTVCEAACPSPLSHSGFNVQKEVV